ncbi:hypothetical protein DFH08DRAFT_823546 [Mycena albidolilacea]|uniref:Uncharacterized protein n=1 Tax=Mycena albidolilacea TaxID=1033008 RepID=A0AAD7EC36_9AGAR|nr:hypothetical protein DFH08DRAFT_823546 [Mycena albidolilacea]
MPSLPRLSSEFHVLGVSGQSFKGIKRRYPNEIAKFLKWLVPKVIHEHGSIVFYHELLQRLSVLIASPYQQRRSTEEKRNDLRALVGPVAPIALDRRTALRGIREIQEVELKLSNGREDEVVQQMLAIPHRNLKAGSSIFGSFTLDYVGTEIPQASAIRTEGNSTHSSTLQLPMHMAAITQWKRLYNSVCLSRHRAAVNVSGATIRFQPPRKIIIAMLAHTSAASPFSHAPQRVWQALWIVINSLNSVRYPQSRGTRTSQSGGGRVAAAVIRDQTGVRVEECKTACMQQDRRFKEWGDELRNCEFQRGGPRPKKLNTEALAGVSPYAWAEREMSHQCRQTSISFVRGRRDPTQSRLSRLVETAPNTLSQEVRKIEAVGLCFAGRTIWSRRELGPWLNAVSRWLRICSGSTVHLRRWSAKQ